MTETVIKKLGVFDEDTRKHKFTIVFEKTTLDKPYYVRCNEKGELVDLRKTQSYVDFDLSTDKLKQVKECYDISIDNTRSFDDECYVKLPTDFKYDLATLLRIAQKTISSKVVFVTDIIGDDFYLYTSPPIIQNVIHTLPYRYTRYRSYTFITEDLLSEDIPIPNRAIKQIKAREDREHKKQSRCKLFETFMLPGLMDIEGFHYDTDNQEFCMDSDDIHCLIEKHIKEVIIPKFEEVGAQINIDDFEVGAFMHCHYTIPLEKVKLDNIDDVE